MAGISSKSLNFGDPVSKIKFNGKELNEDLDVDWYEYGFRNNFDPQLGRFHSVDPLASDYPYYTPYQFAGNQVPNAIDVDGLEPAFFNDLVSWAVQKVTTNPNSGTSKTIGAVAGVGKSIEKTVTGAINLVAHPIESGKALLSMNSPEAMANMAIGVADKVNTLKNGTGFEKSLVISEAVTDVVTSIAGTKGAGAALKGEAVVANVGKAEVAATSTGEVSVTKAYSRPNNATTAAQRASVQGKPCVSCGEKASTMVADHKTPLVKEYYQTGTIDKQNMRSANAVQAQCPTCSARQGAELQRYSIEQKKKNGIQ